MSMNFRRWLVLFNVLFVTLAYGQEKIVTGEVTDESGFALYDASVKIVGGKQVFTDENGSFSIETKIGDLLEVSYLGLKFKSIKVGEALNYVIILGDASFDINPDDIETYNVLKGGPASALYGSRAANGVIMITTKSGKKGKDEIIFNTGVSFDKISIFPKMQNEYGAGLSKEVSPGKSFETVNIGGKNYNIVNYEADQSWGPKCNPNLMVLDLDTFDLEFQNQYLTPRPWIAPKNDIKSFFKTGVSYTNSVSFSKFYENTLARVSLSDMRATGIIPNSELKRTTVSLSINQKFSEKLEVKGDITYVRTNGFNRLEVGYGDNSVMQKFVQWGAAAIRLWELEKL